MPIAVQTADKDKKIVTAMHVRGAGSLGTQACSTSVAVRLEFGTLPGGNNTWRLSPAVSHVLLACLAHGALVHAAQLTMRAVAAGGACPRACVCWGCRAGRRRLQP